MEMIRFIKPEDTYSLRKEILRKNIDLPFVFDGDSNSDSYHLGAFSKSELVSVATFVRKDYKGFKGVQYQLRGMATLDSFRGQGYGKKLVKKSEIFLRNKHVNVIWLNARVAAISFYESLNYSKVGEIFDVPKIGDHYLMFKHLS